MGKALVKKEHMKRVKIIFYMIVFAGVSWAVMEWFRNAPYYKKGDCALNPKDKGVYKILKLSRTSGVYTLARVEFKEPKIEETKTLTIDYVENYFKLAKCPLIDKKEKFKPLYQQ
jgi:hypothetical protein